MFFVEKNHKWKFQKAAKKERNVTYEYTFINSE